MKILHYSDKSAPDFFSLYQQCEILVTTGDLKQFDFAGLEDQKNKKPAFGVYGNHDSGTYMNPLGIIDLHNQIYEYAGLTWGGFQGCLKYKSADAPMYTEDEAKLFADSFPRVDILLLHAGPADMLDDPSDVTHKGSENIQRYINEKHPKVVFLGHQYSNAEMQVGATKLYRTYGARIIEI